MYWYKYTPFSRLHFGKALRLKAKGIYLYK